MALMLRTRTVYREWETCEGGVRPACGASVATEQMIAKCKSNEFAIAKWRLPVNFIPKRRSELRRRTSICGETCSYSVGLNCGKLLEQLVGHRPRRINRLKRDFGVYLVLLATYPCIQVFTQDLLILP